MQVPNFSLLTNLIQKIPNSEEKNESSAASLAQWEPEYKTRVPTIYDLDLKSYAPTKCAKQLNRKKEKNIKNIRK